MKRHNATVAITTYKEELQLITKTRLYNFDPLKPSFYTVKLGFTGVYITFFYFCSKTSTHNLCFEQ